MRSLSQGENLYLLTAPAAGFQGELGDFRIYGSVLSQSQINSLYAGGEATITGTGDVGALPATTAVQIAAGSALDLSGLNQTIGSLSDYTIASGGTVTNSGGTLATLTVAPSGGSSTTFSGVIQDGNAQTALTINGNGTQDLAGANTFSGPTTLTAGTLQLDNAYAVQNSTVSVGTASSLTFGTGVGTVYLGGLAGAGNVTLDDLGNNAVTIQVGGNNASTTYSGVLSGDGGLTKNGTGMLTLGGANTYLGQTLISNGTVQLGAGSASLSPVVRYSFAGGTVGQPAAATYPDLSGNGNTLTIRDGGVQNVAGHFGTALAFTGQYAYSTDIPSNSVLTTMSSWTSSIWIDIPSANIGNNQSMVCGRYSGGPSANGGNGFEMGYQPGSGVWVAVLNTGNSWDWYGDMPATISPDTWTMVTTTVTAAGINLYIDGATSGHDAGPDAERRHAQFTQAGNDITIGYTASLGGCSASLDEFDLFSSVLSGGQITQLYTNQLSSLGSLPSTTPLVIDTAGVFDLNGGSQTVASLSDATPGSGGIVTNYGGTLATLTLAPTGSTTFSGAIQDGTAPMALTVNGTGTQVLAGVNTYSGPTTITAGTLAMGSNTALPAASALTLDLAGVLDLGGFSPTVASLSDGPLGGGMVTNSGGVLSTLTLAPTGGSSTFSGTIQDGAPAPRRP